MDNLQNVHEKYGIFLVWPIISGLGLALVCGWYTQRHLVREIKFPFSRRNKLQIWFFLLLVGNCAHFLLLVVGLWFEHVQVLWILLHSQWGHMCISLGCLEDAISMKSFITFSSSP